MAKDDVVIDIGVQLDETQFKLSFDNFLNSLSTQTHQALEDALANVKGPAAKNWSSVPYQLGHENAGAATMSQAFVPGFARDLKDLGIRRGTQFYEAALMSAVYRSSVSDPVHRYNLLQSYGQNAPTPDSAIEHVLNTDYEMLSKTWSREFMRKDRNGNLLPDFAGMRDYAVEQGIGRWIDEDKGHTADNFELINDALDDITETADDIGDSFTEWGERLKGVLGTLTAIGGLLVKVGAAAIGAGVAYDAKAYKGTQEAATTLDRRRAFVGMSALDELAAQVAGQSIGLGKNAVTNEIIDLSNSTQKYKLLGEGLNPLFPSLSGIFDNMMGSENPLETYKGILREMYNAMHGADPTKRSQALMLLESQGLTSAARIIGGMLSNESLAKDLDYDPGSLFSLRNNKYYNVYEGSEAMLPDLTKLNLSIQTSYKEMYKTWTEEFGEPFRKWWDETLQNTVVPWFQKLIRKVKGKETQEDLIDDIVEGAKAEIGLIKVTGAGGRKKALRNQDVYYSGDYTPQTVTTLGRSGWNTFLTGDMSYRKGDAARVFWDKYVEIANTSDKDIEKLYNSYSGQEKAMLGANWVAKVKDARNRVKYMVERIQAAGLSTFLENTDKEYIDSQLLEALQMGAVGEKGGQIVFDNYIERVLKASNTSEADEKIYAVLEKIEQNTEASKKFAADEDAWLIIANTVGTEQANKWRNEMHNRK